MRWQDRRRSSNVDDRRGRGGAGKGIMGGGIGLIVLIIFTLLGGNPADIIENTNIINPDANVPYVETAEEREMADFVSVVLEGYIFSTTGDFHAGVTFLILVVASVNLLIARRWVQQGRWSDAVLLVAISLLGFDTIFVFLQQNTLFLQISR